MKNEHFNELIDSIKEAGKIKRGETEASRTSDFSEPDIKAIRESIGFSQAKFATLIGVSVRTLQNWEQGHRQPTGPAKVLLRLVQADPNSVVKNTPVNHT